MSSLACFRLSPQRVDVLEPQHPLVGRLKLANATLQIPGTGTRDRRTWRTGNRMTIWIPMRLTSSPIDHQHPHRVASCLGSIMLVRTEVPWQVPSWKDFSRWLISSGSPLEIHTTESSVGTFVPFYRGAARSEHKHDLGGRSCALVAHRGSRPEERL